MDIANPTSLGLRNKIFGVPGFSMDMKLADEELCCFRAAIEAQWLAHIRASRPEFADRFEQVGLENYHVLANLVAHERLWVKRNRVLPQPTVEKIRKLGFMQKLREEFGAFSLSDVVYDNAILRGQEEIYWRIVRPNVASDIGPLHADQWFHRVLGGGDGMFARDAVTVKIWIAIYCEPGKSGLVVVPNSHLKEWRHSYVTKGGDLKPKLDEDVEVSTGPLLDTSPGAMVIFNERLLHGGVVNRGTTTRVSAEITLVLSEGSDRLSLAPRT